MRRHEPSSQLEMVTAMARSRYAARRFLNCPRAFPLRKLRPHEIEDVLYIYEDWLGDLDDTRPALNIVQTINAFPKAGYDVGPSR
jgi:hypothetical protein